MSEPQTETRTCRFPGCQRPAALGDGTGRPPEYCDDPAHNRVTAWRARKLMQEGSRQPESRPVDAARQRASVITGQVTGMIEHLGQQMTVLLEELRTVGDPEAVEVQLEAVSSEAAEQVASANARASRAEQAQRRAEAEREEADAAAVAAPCIHSPAVDDVLRRPNVPIAVIACISSNHSNAGSAPGVWLRGWAVDTG